MGSLHELYWFSKTGSCAQRLKPYKLPYLVMTGSLFELDYYLDCQFICIAMLYKSTLAYVSAVLFLISNIVGQLILFTCIGLHPQHGIRPHPLHLDRWLSTIGLRPRRLVDLSIFQSRGFHVMHEILVNQLPLLPFESEQREVSKAWIIMFHLIKVLFEDVCQFIIQV